MNKITTDHVARRACVYLRQSTPGQEQLGKPAPAICLGRTCSQAGLARGGCHLVLHWQGGDHTEIRLQKIRTGQHRFVTEADIVETVRALARIEPDARIASILNKNGRRSAHGQIWTARLVCSLRHNRSIAVYEEGERQIRGEVSVSEAARTLGITPISVLRLIRLKQLSATQACGNAPWILRRIDVEQLAATCSGQAVPPAANKNQRSLKFNNI